MTLLYRQSNYFRPNWIFVHASGARFDLSATAAKCMAWGGKATTNAQRCDMLFRVIAGLMQPTGDEAELDKGLVEAVATMAVPAKPEYDEKFYDVNRPADEPIQPAG